MMNPDIKLIRLRRTKMKGKMGQPGDDSRFVADYFDIMQIKSLSLNQPFSEWLDISRSDIQEDGIASQSYTLYCSSAMLEQYDGEDKKRYRKDPFGTYEEMGCLSIIHVYITPEILARMSDKADDIGNDSNGILLRPFMDDLYDILDMFFDRNAQELFAARVYMMLSAGDFAIVVKSKEPDTAYHIATYLRKRRAGKEGGEGADENKAYVLYKTYTLSSIGRKIIHLEEDLGETQGRKNTKDRFIVRGSYSNSYWRDHDSAQIFSGGVNDEAGGFHPLSGRYDFTVRMSEEEFCQALSPDDNDTSEENGEGLSERAKRLKYLIKGDYLSSMNERYLMDKTEPECNDLEMTSRSVFLSKEESEGSDLYNKNIQQIEALHEKSEEIIKKSRTISGYRKNIQQYLSMLHREICLCTSINESSDTRIYARMLIELLGTVLDSTGQYIDMCAQGLENDKWINALEDNLRKSIAALDSYAQYIRNNNLQSIQTPNYNIETAMGMEKILIGYSEFLWCFIEFYKRAMKTVSKKEHLTIMVPNLHDRDVNIDAMFSEETISDTGTEIPNAGEKKMTGSGQGRRLIVIGSPTLEEITDFPVIFPALFHEIAHQFRYEDRLTRNRAVLRATVREIMQGFAKYLTKAVNERVDDESNEAGKLCTALTEGLTDLFIIRKYPAGEDSALRNKSLEQFQDEIYNSLDELFDIWKWKSRLKGRIREFIFELRYELDYSNQNMLKWVKELYEIVHDKPSEDSEKPDEDSEKPNEDNEEKKIGKAKECAFNLAGICACRYLTGTDKGVWNPVNVTDREERAWDLEWKQIFSTDTCNNSDEVKLISEVFFNFLAWTEGYEEELKRNGYIGPDSILQRKQIKIWKGFENTLHGFVKKSWEKVERQSVAVYNGNCRDMKGVPSYRYWTHVGRILGLDYDAEVERFDEVVKEVLTAQRYEVESSFLELYREVTADLLMCNVMGMSAVEYVNLVVSLFVPEGDFYHGPDMERVFNVLYIQWCYDRKKGKEEAWKAYRKLCWEIFTKVLENANNVLDMANGVTPDFPSGDDVVANTKAEEIIAGSMEALKTCRKKAIENEDIKKIWESGNILRIYSLLIDLIWNGKYYYINLHREKAVLKDLVRGHERLRNLPDESPGYYEKGICKIFEMGKTVSGYLSHSYSQKGTGNSEELNKECVELLLTMYYHNKTRIAQKGRGKKADEN